jgi:hypothetical protein
MTDLIQTVSKMDEYMQTVSKMKEVCKRTEEKFIEQCQDSSDYNRELFHKTMVMSDFSGIEEYSEIYYKLYNLYMIKQSMTGDALREEFTKRNFTHMMLKYGTLVSEAYLYYWLVWCQHVNSKEMIEFITNNPIKDDELLNLHTTLYVEDGKYKHKSNYEMFAKEIDRILNIMQNWIEDLKTLNLATDEKPYIEYLEHYCLCLGCTDIGALNGLWEKLDVLWCDIKNPVQLVHGMEYGYEEPTRSKVSPDFSIRFLDQSYETENRMMDDVNALLRNYFSERNTERSRNDLKALTNSFAGIYFIPVTTGSGCFFRLMGQAIPNDTKVRNEKGVKIYCDPESAGSRIEIVKKNLLPKLFKDKDELKMSIDNLKCRDLLVYTLGGHEFGHTIYNLEAIPGIDAELKTILEEPRADRISFLTIKLALQTGMITEEFMKTLVRSYVCEETRRFSVFDNHGLRPYIISATGIYKMAEECGYILYSQEGFTINDDKSFDLVNIVVNESDEILNCVDTNNLERLQQIATKMAEPNDFIKWVVGKLK